MNKRLAICGATVIDTYTGAKDKRDILIEGERIAEIAPVGSFDIPANIERVDARGRFVIPGLWDAHIHVTRWPEYDERLPSLLTAYGITSVRDMGAPLDDILGFREKALQKTALAPRIWFAGPYLNSSPLWTPTNQMSAEVDTKEEAFELIDKLAAAGIHFVKAYEMLLPEVFKAIVERVKQHGLKVAGHIPISLTVKEVLEVEPHYDIQHLGGGSGSSMRFDCACFGDQLHLERKGIMESNRVRAETGVEVLRAVEQGVTVSPADQDPEKRAELINLFIEKGTWHTPTLVVLISLEALGLEQDPERLKALQYMPQDFMKEKQTMLKGVKGFFDNQIQWGPWVMETVGLMHEAGVPLLAGTDSPPILTYTPGLALHFELQALVQSGVSPLAALQAATLNPARFFDIENDLGSIAKGKYADLLLLEDDPLKDITNTRKIVSVLSRGHYLDRQALDNLFESMTEPVSTEA